MVIIQPIPCSWVEAIETQAETEKTIQLSKQNFENRQAKSISLVESK